MHARHNRPGRAARRARSAGRLAATLLPAILAAGLASQAARAEGPDVLADDTLYVSLGTFVLNSDTTARLDGSTGQGTPVDWDKTFPDKDTSRVRLDGFWRFANRHKLRFLWFDASTSGSRTIDEEIEWGGEIIPVNAKVRGESSFAIYELAYEYAFLRREDYELTGTFGVHYADYSIGLSATVLTPGGGSRKIGREGSADLPLPVFGLRGLWNFYGDFWLDASGQYFALSIEDYDGSVQDYRIAVSWQPKTWLGIGIGYNAFLVDVDLEKRSFTGSLDWQYEGPQAFISAAF